MPAIIVRSSSSSSSASSSSGTSSRAMVYEQPTIQQEKPKTPIVIVVDVDQVEVYTGDEAVEKLG